MSTAAGRVNFARQSKTRISTPGKLMPLVLLNWMTGAGNSQELMRDSRTS
jgi:hypothetical protein